MPINKWLILCAYLCTWRYNLGMKTLAFAFLLFTTATHSGFAAEAGKIEGVSLSQSMEFPAKAGAVKLNRISAGLRYKKVVFIKAKVYVAQLFGNDPSKFKRSESEALLSLKDQSNLAIQLTFLRSVDAEKIQNAYKEGFKENAISADEAGVKEFLVAAGAGGDSKDGSTISISAERLPGGQERITYVGPNKKAAEVNGTSGLIEKIFSLFLGKMSDSGLESLKKDLTSS
jgi:hypothetical protein